MEALERSIPALGNVKPEPETGRKGKKARVSEVVPPILSEEQATSIEALKPFLKAIADTNRVAILQELSNVDGLSVLDLSDRLMLSQPLTSWHLHILKRARLVKPTHQGRQRIYRLDRERIKEYRELFQWVTDF
ncbi:MAG TPA: metalloregulator ArsR/SmtB family transcription factor [Chloroflexia bacterium]